MNRCRVVLVGTQIAANVGSVARVMRNFGCTDLVLVAPQCDVRTEQARATATHHADETGGPQPQVLLDHVVAAANALSAARPGARREQLASYIKRLDDLEAICKRFGGVERAYALMAGREIRVMVMNDQIDDALSQRA